jgi:putative flippase GtrA
MIQQFMSRQFLMFFLTGGTAAAINFGSRILYSQWLGFFFSRHPGLSHGDDYCICIG